MKIKLVLVCVAALLTSACSSEEGPSSPAECNPLGGPACLMPWPSSAYLQDDPNTATGVRLDLPAEAMPVNIDGIPVRPEYFNRFDGFSVSGPMLVDFETGVSADGLPQQSDVGASLRPDAPVVLINMDTGDRVMLFAEPDLNAKEPQHQTLIIRPVERLDSSSRYAVAVRKSVRAADGGEIPVPEAFQRLLDGGSLDHPLADRIEGEYPEIFEVLEDAGIPRDDLLMAWSFRTASDEFLFKDLLAMRSQALDMMGPEAAGFDFDVEVLDNDNPQEVRHFLAGTYDVPMFLTDGESDTSVLERDGAGVPVASSTARAKWAGIVPSCVETEPLPRPAVIFGHGMFGNSLDSLDYSFLQKIAEDNCVVVIGGDWIGLTNRQFAAVAFAMNDINRGLSLTEKLHQALINFITLERMARYRLSSAPELQIDGQPIIDPNDVQYFGASLGGILGTVFMALDPDIDRGALGVAGGPWSLLFERSTYWPPLRITMKGAYVDSPWDYQQNVAFFGMMFESIDPVTAASRVLANPLPDTKPKQVFLYMAMGDALVSNVASFALTRALQVPITSPSVRSSFGTEEKSEPVPSGMTVYDEGVAIEDYPPENNAMEGLEYNGTHGDVNEQPAVRRQVFELLLGGQVRHECRLEGSPAPCLCTTGACD